MKYIDHYHIMNYDYTFPDIPNKQPLSPTQNLYNAPLPVVQWFINYAMHGYLAACVTIAGIRCCVRSRLPSRVDARPLTRLEQSVTSLSARIPPR